MNDSATESDATPPREALLPALLRMAEAEGYGHDLRSIAGECMPDVLRFNDCGGVFVGMAEADDPRAAPGAGDRLRAGLLYLGHLLEAGVAPDASFALVTRTEQSAQLWLELAVQLAAEARLDGSCLRVSPAAQGLAVIATWR